MPLLKKINDSWQPAENRGLQLGEVIDFPGDVEVLVKTGMAMIVDEAGNEMELPNQRFTCPICFNDAIGLMGFVDHVTGHSPKTKKIVTEEPKVEVPVEVPSAEKSWKDLTPEEQKARRIANLEKARAARKGTNV